MCVINNFSPHKKCTTPKNLNKSKVTSIFHYTLTYCHSILESKNNLQTISPVLINLKFHTYRVITCFNFFLL